MPTWSIVLIAVLALLVAGAVLERRQGHRRLTPRDTTDQERAAIETRMDLRGRQGPF